MKNLTINVGDYVRTKDGHIDKIIDIDEEYHCRENDKQGKLYKIYQLNNEYYDEEYEEYNQWVFDDYIIKSSPNIIDLIEVEDYVNGCKIIDICIDEMTNLKYLETDITEFDNIYACGHINIYEKDIRTIVTKECFESMEYKIER